MSAHSNDVAAARAQVRAAHAEARGARLLPNPVGDFTVANLALGRTNPAGLGLDRTLIYGAGLSETVELAKRGPRASAADLRARAAARRVWVTLADRIADARQALGHVVYCAAREQVLGESLRAATAATDVAKGRLAHQALSGVDYDRLLIDLSGLQSDLARAQAETRSAFEVCNATLLSACDASDASVADLDAAVTLPESPALPALEQRADLEALRLERDAASHDAILAERRAIPDLTFRLGYTHDTFTISGDNLNTLSLSVALPIPVFDHGQHEAARALARADELEQTSTATLVMARGEVNSLFTRKRALEAALAAIENDMLPRANGVLAAQEQGLAEGQLDITDLLLARRQAIALRTQALDLRFELFNLKNDLRHALGLDAASSQR